MLVSFVIMKKSSHLFYFTRQKEIKQSREKKKRGGWEGYRAGERYFQTCQSLFSRLHVGFTVSAGLLWPFPGFPMWKPCLFFCVQ